MPSSNASSPPTSPTSGSFGPISPTSATFGPISPTSATFGSLKSSRRPSMFSMSSFTRRASNVFSSEAIARRASHVLGIDSSRRSSNTSNFALESSNPDYDYHTVTDSVPHPNELDQKIRRKSYIPRYAASSFANSTTPLAYRDHMAATKNLNSENAKKGPHDSVIS